MSGWDPHAFSTSPRTALSSNSTLRQGTLNSGQAAHTSSQSPALRVSPSGCRTNENRRLRRFRAPITNLRSSTVSVLHPRPLIALECFGQRHVRTQPGTIGASRQQVRLGTRGASRSGRSRGRQTGGPLARSATVTPGRPCRTSHPAIDPGDSGRPQRGMCGIQGRRARTSSARSAAAAVSASPASTLTLASTRQPSGTLDSHRRTLRLTWPS